MAELSREEIIRGNFKDHVATLTEHGDLKVLEWKKPGTCFYYVRYVFDGKKVYISGDLGEAVFFLTWEADIHSFNNVGLGYFHEKLSAYHGDKYDFDSEKAIKILREWIQELNEENTSYDSDDMEELLEGTKGCDSEWQWASIVNNQGDFISDLDVDYWEWMYDIGRTYPIRIHAYLIGLQMASEKLKGGK